MVEVTVVVEACELKEIVVELCEEVDGWIVRLDDDENALATVDNELITAAFVVTVVVTVAVTTEAIHKGELVDGDMVFVVNDGT